MGQSSRGVPGRGWGDAGREEGGGEAGRSRPWAQRQGYRGQKMTDLPRAAYEEERLAWDVGQIRAVSERQRERAGAQE